MKNLYRFRVACILLLVVSLIAVWFEFYVYDLASMARLYFWAYAAIGALVGNAAGACLAWLRTLEEKKQQGKP